MKPTEEFEEQMFLKAGASTLKTLSSLEITRENYLVKKYYPFEKQFVFERGMILLGKEWLSEYMKRMVEKGEKKHNDIYINFRYPIRLLLIAKTGEGKTMIIRRMFDYSYFFGMNGIWFDMKNEVKSSARPQRKYLNLLAPTDKPLGIKLMVLRPAFFRKFIEKEEEVPEGNTYFKYHFKDVSVRDFLAAIGARNENEVIVMQKIWSESNTLDEMREKLKEEKIDSRMRIRLDRAVENLQRFEIFTDEENERFDVVKLLNMGFHISFNFSNLHEIESGDVPDAAQIYFSIIMRSIFDGANNKKLDKRKTFVIVEEAPSLINKKSMVYRDVKQVVLMGRKAGIYVAFSTQFWEKSGSDEPPIEPWIIENCDYLFLSKMTSIGSLGRLLSQYVAGKYTYTASERSDISNELSAMSRETNRMRNWILVNRLSSKLHKFSAYCSLSEHED